MLVNKEEMNARMNELVFEKVDGMVKYSKKHDLGAVLMCADQFKGLIDGAYCYGELNLFKSLDLRQEVRNTMHRIWGEYNS